MRQLPLTLTRSGPWSGACWPGSSTRCARFGGKACASPLTLSAQAVHHHGAFDSDSDFDLDDEDGLLPGMDADGAARLLAEAAAEEPPAVVAARRAATRAKCGARGGVYFASRGRTLNGARGGEGEAAALPLADEQQVRALLREMPPSHAAQRAAVLAESEKLFPRWKALLGAGFSVLLYGLGSKREVIEAFRDSELCSDGASVCVHGHHPSLTTRILLSHCIEALALPPVVMPGGTGSGAGARLAVEEASLRCIAAATAPGPETEQQFRLYVFIHSVDGVALRNPEAQACLASLAALPGVGLLASCDHVNAPLLWHKRAAGQLKWVWEHVSTFARLDLETRHAPPLLRPAGEERARRGAAGVLLSLTPNARTVFKVLAEEQLRGGSDAAGGLPFARWFELCRSTFSVSSETQLRAHLGEFVDHGLVKRLRRTDGVDAVLIKLSVEDMRAMIDVIAGAA